MSILPISMSVSMSVLSMYISISTRTMYTRLQIIWLCIVLHTSQSILYPVRISIVPTVHAFSHNARHFHHGLSIPIRHHRTTYHNRDLHHHRTLQIHMHVNLDNHHIFTNKPARNLNLNLVSSFRDTKLSNFDFAYSYGPSFLARNKRLYNSNGNGNDNNNENGYENDKSNDNEDDNGDGDTNGNESDNVDRDSTGTQDGNGNGNGNPVVKLNFENLFQGMPSLGDIIQDPDLTPDTQGMAPRSRSTTNNNDDNENDDNENDDRDIDDNANEDVRIIPMLPPLSPKDLQQIDDNVASVRLDVEQKLTDIRQTNEQLNYYDSPTDNAKDDTTRKNTNTSATESILNQVIQEQRDLDIKELTEKRAMDSFDNYQDQKLMQFNVDNVTLNNPIDDDGTTITHNNTVVKEIIEKAQEKSYTKQASIDEYNQFIEYEADIQQRYTNAADDNSEDEPKIQSTDFDEVQLQLMQQLLNRTQTVHKNDDQNGDDLDLYRNIEIGIEELKTKIASRSSKDSLTSDKSLKEWQMYRAIATKRAKDRDTKSKGKGKIQSQVADNEVDEDSVEIEKQVDAWKEFQKKEEEMRQATGLAIQVRMPFEWNVAPDIIDERVTALPSSTQPKTTTGTNSNTKQKSLSSGRVITKQGRYELDQLAVQILQDLMDNTADLERRQNLKQDIDEIKTDMEQRLQSGLDDDDNDNTIVKDIIPLNDFKPVSMSTILKSSSTEQRDAKDQTTKVSSDEGRRITLSSDDVQDNTTQLNVTPPIAKDYAEQHESKEDDGNEDAGVVHNRQDVKEDNNEDAGVGDYDELPNLGSFEQQKFRSLVAGSGVRTDAEEKELRRSWEEFQRAEQAMRDSNGLSSPATVMTTEMDNFSNESILSDSTPDLSFLTVEGNDQDNFMGASPDQKVSYEEFQKYEEQTKQAMLDTRQEEGGVEDGNDTIGSSSVSADEDKLNKIEEDDVIIHNKKATQWGRSSYSDQMYRSVGAANGGKEQETDQREKNKAAFQDLLQRQDENRRLIQDMSSNLNVTNATPDSWEIDDINDYAEKALSSLGARPKVSQKEEDPEISSSSSLNVESKSSSSPSSSTTSPKKNRGNSKMKSVGMKNPSRSSRSTVLSEQMPDWLRREIEEVRGEEFLITDEFADDDNDDISDDDLESDDKYLENERQAEEFGMQILGATKVIDVGSVLGRDVFSSDGLAEYDSEEQRLSDTFSSFDARKANLLEYTVLSVAELNALMEHKRSSLENDASPYASKINWPFSEYAAIFRLEGVLVDTSGLHFNAWKRTAEEHGLKTPTLDDIKFASVHHEEFAVRKIFYWADDIVTCRKIVLTYQKMMLDEIKKWTKKNSTDTVEHQKQPAMIIDSFNTTEYTSIENTNILEEIEPLVLESDLIRLQTESWNMVADDYGLDAPSAEVIQIAGTLNPSESVRAVFGWTNNASQAIEMARSYRRHLRELTENLAYIKDIHIKLPALRGDRSEADEDEAKNSEEIGESDLLDIRFHGWNIAAERYNFKQPSIEEVQLAMWSTPSDVIKDIMRWTIDEELVNDIVATYQDACRLKSVTYSQNSTMALPDEPSVPKPGAVTETKPPPEVTSSGPSKDDVIKLQHDAWKQTANKLNLPPPTIDEVCAASFMDPSQATTSVFNWSLAIDEIESVVTAFRANLKSLSRPWIKKVQLQESKLQSGSLLEAEESLPFIQQKEGTIKWLKTLQDVHMPCVVVSYMSSEILDTILREMGLAEFFSADKRVSSSSGYELDMQQMLGGALRAERRPDECALFSSTPQSAASAHDVEMKNVALVSPYPYYELQTADMTVRGFETIQVINMKNIFNNENSEPMEELQLEGPEVKIRSLTKTKFWDEDGF